MAIKEKSTIKNYFRQGDIPTESQYMDLIDTFVSITGSNTGDLHIIGNITASGAVSSSGTGSFSQLQLPAGGSIQFDSTVGSNDQFITGEEHNITIDGDQKVRLIASSIVEIGNDVNLPKVSINPTSGNISSSGNLIVNEITASGNISSSGDIYSNKYLIQDGEGNTAINRNNSGILFGNIYEPMILRGSITNINQSGGLWVSAGHITASGNISASGALIGNSLTLGGTAITSTAAEINYLDGLTSGEATQIKAIDTKTISNTQWGYVGNMNQDVTNGSLVQFAGITITKNEIYEGNYGETVATEGQSFRLTLADVPFIPGRASGLIAKSVPTLIRNSSTTASSVILATVATAELSINAFKVVDGFFNISLGNEAFGDFGGGNVTINFTIF